MNPYKNLPPKAFWKLSVSSKSMFDIDNLWEPKFKISPKRKIVTFGSCFAQHIGNALESRGFKWLSTELPPEGLSENNAKLFNYNVFSCRTGNIYTTSLLKQWTEWSLGKSDIPDEIWEKDGRYYDPFRPRIEPNGFASKEEVNLSRLNTVKSFREGIQKADYFVFTLGLTESWIHEKKQYEYPMCPGTAAGTFEPENHKFVNQSYGEILRNISDAMIMMRQVKKGLRFILTVSPIPLTATKSDRHVLVATMESKSVLRAVAGALARNKPYVDYFPSYEIINSPVFKGSFFEPNQRSVNMYGVNFVMDHFFNCLVDKYGDDVIVSKNSTKVADKEDNLVICEEALLEAFGEKK